MDEPKPRRPRWGRKRTIAALLVWLCLPVLYLASEGPVMRLALQGRIPQSVYRPWFKPIVYAEPWLPDAVNGVRGRWIAWWMPPIGEWP